MAIDLPGSWPDASSSGDDHARSPHDMDESWVASSQVFQQGDQPREVDANLSGKEAVRDKKSVAALPIEIIEQ